MPDLVIHAFTDGRDTSPTSGAASLAEIEAACRERGTGRIGSVIGRYYAMDRDQRWERTEQAVDLLCEGTAEHHAETGEEAVKDAYDRGETDEFITATTVGEEARIRPGDAVLAFNFRPDRMRQITTKLTEVVDAYTTLTQYDEDWTFPVVVPAAPPGDHDRQGDRRRRARAAARGRDGEVPARDVLLQRRRGGAVRRARCASSRRPRATSRRTTTSRR